MVKIVAIGGGEISRPDQPEGTLALDAEVVRLAEKRRPRLVFLPTATHDDAGYVAIVEEYYGRRLGCDVSSLLLYDRAVSDADIERSIRSADIIYVGGGNTAHDEPVAPSRHRSPARSRCPRRERARRHQCRRDLLVLIRHQRLPIVRFN
jgi:hypothetical protein